MATALLIGKQNVDPISRRLYRSTGKPGGPDWHEYLAVQDPAPWVIEKPRARRIKASDLGESVVLSDIALTFDVERYERLCAHPSGVYVYERKK